MSDLVAVVAIRKTACRSVSLDLILLTPLVLTLILSKLSSSSPISVLRDWRMKTAIALYWKCPCFHPVRWKRLPYQGPPHCPSCSLRLLARSSICRVTVSFDKLMSRNFVFCSWHTRGILAVLHKFSITERFASAGYFLNYHVASLCYSFTRFGQICENWWQCSLFQVGQAYWCAPHRWICCRFYDWYHNAVLCSIPWALH